MVTEAGYYKMDQNNPFPPTWSKKLLMLVFSLGFLQDVSNTNNGHVVLQILVKMKITMLTCAPHKFLPQRYEARRVVCRDALYKRNVLMNLSQDLLYLVFIFKSPTVFEFISQFDILHKLVMAGRDDLLLVGRVMGIDGNSQTNRAMVKIYVQTAGAVKITFHGRPIYKPWRPYLS